MTGQLYKLRGQVQGVGFRPAVWKLASEMGFTGDVRNTNSGVEIRLWGQEQQRFIDRLYAELPQLAEIEDVVIDPIAGKPPASFAIVPSSNGEMQTNITPDAATCEECLFDIQDPFSDRYRYAFNNCTNCGPRYSIIEGAPYDRNKTTMRDFTLCASCTEEFNQPSDRRFHAQPIACYHCGPRAWLEHLGGGFVNAEAFSMMDDVDAAGGALKNGHIVAIKGIGGFHLACDATKAEVVNLLRKQKRRAHKAFALMAKDIDIVRRYALVSDEEEALLRSPASPIVLLATSGEELPDSIAPGLDRVGFMLPHTPIHHLMLRRMERPIVMTSGNISGQPQCISNEQAKTELTDVAKFALMHNRDIANRIDDSVVKVDMGQSRVIRRSRGYAPMSIPLPEGFSHDISLTAMGAEQKNTFCLVKNGRAILSPHMGDLEDLHTYDESTRSLELFTRLFEHSAEAFAVDCHPDYLSSKRGYELADDKAVYEIQHHHAHIASCLAQNQYPIDAGPVLGVVMDGSGLGDDGTVWGGEFLIADYATYQREACLKPVALPGGSAAVREPWRNAYAHLMAEMGWVEFESNFTQLDVFNRLKELPLESLNSMLETGTNTPLASSCGRLFDAVAALTGLAWDEQSYEGQAAMQFEAAIEPSALNESEDYIYPFSIPRLNGSGMPYIEPLAVWRAVLGDLLLGTPVGVIAARFHRGLARAIVTMVTKLTQQFNIDTAVLTGGCFQNSTLFELTHQGLEKANIRVLSHTTIPANDGGLSLGQAAVALARIQLENAHVSRNTR